MCRTKDSVYHFLNLDVRSRGYLLTDYIGKDESMERDIARRYKQFHSSCINNE